MRKEYDFSQMTGKKNPHARRLKKQVTIRLGIEAIEYFKEMSEATWHSLSKPNQFLSDRLCPKPEKIGREMVLRVL